MLASARFKVCVLGAVLSAATSTVGAARAQSDEARERLAEAQAAFEAGEAAFAVRDYVGALTHFQRAHELTGAPALLYNVGLVADRLGRSELAVDSYRGYLRGEPDAPDRVQIERRISELSPESSVTEPVASPTVGAPERVSPPDPPARGRTWTWVAAGVTGAAAIATAALWIGAQVTYDDLEADCGPTCSQAQVDDSGGPTMQVLGNVSFGVGLGALAATVALFLLEAPGDVEVRVGVGPGAILLHGNL